MASRETLLKVNYITDHSCGSYRIGEIDTLPDEAIKQHINRFGEYGFEQLRDFAIRILNVSTKENSLSDLLTKAAAFDERQTKDDAQARIAAMKPVHAAILQVESARFENSRLQPIISALATIAVAVDRWNEVKRIYGFDCTVTSLDMTDAEQGVRDALDALRKVCGE